MTLALTSSCTSDDKSVDLPDVDAGGGNGLQTCALVAAIEADPSAMLLESSGAIRCSETAVIRLETCLQWMVGGQFEDLQCISATATDSETSAVSSGRCGLDSSQKYRTRVNADVDGVSQTEKLSAETDCL